MDYKKSSSSKSLSDKAKAQFANSIRMTMKREDIMPFINHLHLEQLKMIESVVELKEKEGFPEAQAIIKYIMEKK